MGVFRELLSIKEFRQDKAELSVRRQRATLADAIAAREAAERALEEFRQWALRHERVLYDGLCSRVIRLRDIEDVQVEVASMRQREAQEEAQAREAEARRVREAEKLEADRKALQEATRMKEKFVELARIHAEEEVKEMERKEDAELEEVAETRRERADWDGLQEEPA